MKKRFLVLFGVALVLIAGSAAFAQFARTDDAIAYRKATMVLLGHHFDQIAAVVKGQTAYQPETAADQARLVKIFSALPWAAFSAPGSDKGATRMKPAALSSPEKFMAAAKAFEADADRLAAAAESGTLDAVKPPFGKAAQSCKACHEQFKSR